MPDPLSEILKLTRARGVFSTGLRVSGSFAIHVALHEGMKFNAITEGACWLKIDGQQPITLGTGDCFLITTKSSFTLGNDPSAEILAAEDVFAGATSGFAILDRGPGPHVTFVGGKMISTRNMSLLTSAIPPLIILRAGTDMASKVQWLLKTLENELSNGAPGAEAMSEQIMQMIFITMIRSSAEQEKTRGWLSALKDARIGKAIEAIHARPSHGWKLEELATICNLSRSQFAARFRNLAGVPPLDYVTRWRMVIAREALEEGLDTNARIAARVGYGSEAAFGAAFKRIYGVSPRRLSLSNETASFE